MKKDKKKEVDGGGVPEWMVSYGDVMTLLLTFFVLLFSFSTIDAKKWKELVNSFSGEVAVIQMQQKEETSVINLTDHKTGADDSIINKPEEMKDVDSEPGDEDDTKDEADVDMGEILDEKFEEIYEKINEIANNNVLGAKFQVIMTRDEIILRFDNQLLFDSGEATLDTEALNVLVEIAPVIEEYEDAISKLMIEGNTDNVPISTLRYRDNFELSMHRALTVLYYLRDQAGFPEDKMMAVGHGEYNAIASNDTEFGRAQNRRTDIVLVKKVSGTAEEKEKV